MTHHYPRCGFTVLEITLVMLIVAVLALLSLSTGKTTLYINDIRETKGRLEQLQNALVTFQKKHARYPCPANPADDETDASYGTEIAGCDGTCPAELVCSGPAISGSVPFKTLGIGIAQSYDVWGGKISYTVDAGHVSTSDFNTGNISIQDSSANEITASSLLGKAIFALVSHGPDGNGAYNLKGLNTIPCGSAKDAENCDGDAVFMESRMNNGSDPSENFDDFIVWQTQKNVQQQTTILARLRFSIGNAHVCAIKPDDTLWCWGDANFGALGKGTTSPDEPAPIAVPGMSDVVQVVAGSAHTCALKKDQSVWCWGDNTYGQIGDGTASVTPVASPYHLASLTDVKRLILAGKTSHETCVLKTDNTVWCWGNNALGLIGTGASGPSISTPTHIAGLDHTVQITGGLLHRCGRKSDGTVLCWGDNGSGQLGDNTTTPDLIPKTVPGLGGVIDIEAGLYHNCALINDGTVRCWGRGDEGQLGDGASATRLVATAIPAFSSVKAVTAGHNHSCALMSDATVQCWGNNNQGQLGDGTILPQASPQAVPAFSGGNLIEAGPYVTGVMKTNGEIWMWGSAVTSPVVIPAFP